MGEYVICWRSCRCWYNWWFVWVSWCSLLGFSIVGWFSLICYWVGFCLIWYLVLVWFGDVSCLLCWLLSVWCWYWFINLDGCRCRWFWMWVVCCWMLSVFIGSCVWNYDFDRCCCRCGLIVFGRDMSYLWVFDIWRYLWIKCLLWYFNFLLLECVLLCYWFLVMFDWIVWVGDFYNGDGEWLIGVGLGCCFKCGSGICFSSLVVSSCYWY